MPSTQQHAPTISFFFFLPFLSSSLPLACNDARASPMLLASKGHFSRAVSLSAAVATSVDTSWAFSWRVNTCCIGSVDWLLLPLWLLLLLLLLW